MTGYKDRFLRVELGGGKCLLTGLTDVEKLR